jgi:hypothetical protein
MTEFTLGNATIRSYRRLSYTAWHALAEFVDNSTQSYFDHKEELLPVLRQEGAVLTVDMLYDPDAATLTISDNSYGMDIATLDRAMTVGAPPPDPTGRSRYGMGLKTAACWLGDRWSVKTTQLGDETEYTIEIDVEAIAQGDTELPVNTVRVDPDSHYTVITIEELNVTFKGRRIGKVKDYLSSMYREDLRSEEIRLIWQGQPLKWQTARGQFLKDAAGKEYKKDVATSVELDPRGDDNVPDRARVRGWVGILEKGGFSEAGFSIFHSNRIIKGYPDSWRPQEIFGQEQGTSNLVNQRIVGEFHLDDFPVTHTKDDLVWSDQEQERVERAIKAEVSDYLIIADSTRTRIRSGPQRGSVGKATKSIATDVARNQGHIGVAPVDAVLDDRRAEANATTDRFRQASADLEATLLGRPLRAFFSDEESPGALFAAITTGIDQEVLVVANLRHPFLKDVVSTEALDAYLRLVLIDAALLAETNDVTQAARWITLRDDLMRSLAPGADS